MLDNLSATYTQAQHAVQSHDAQRKQLFDPMNETASELARIQQLLSTPLVQPPDSHLQTRYRCAEPAVLPRTGSSTPLQTMASFQDPVVTRTEFGACRGSFSGTAPTKVTVSSAPGQGMPLPAVSATGPAPVVRYMA
mmetsp:Transcript_66748/g.155056  ORF Transcript_66748/g.155056 Transcript_66748/m.155056 type:complete len:137 (-) Transcript_66748:128-538(-)